MGPRLTHPLQPAQKLCVHCLLPQCSEGSAYCLYWQAKGERAPQRWEWLIVYVWEELDDREWHSFVLPTKEIARKAQRLAWWLGSPVAGYRVTTRVKYEGPGWRLSLRLKPAGAPGVRAKEGETRCRDAKAP